MMGFIAIGFMAFGLVLLAVPTILVARKIKPWREVVGLWLAGWGFLLIGAGTRFAEQGWGGMVVPGVIVTTMGHLMQRRAVRK